MQEGLAGAEGGCGSRALCGLEAQGAGRDRCEARRDREGSAAPTARLRRHGAPPGAVGRPSGLRVDHRVQAGVSVVPIRPGAARARRPRPRAACARSDPGEAARHRPRTHGGPRPAPAGLGEVRARLPTHDPLAAEAGLARPCASGQSRGVGGRRACTKRLRAAPTGLARHARHARPRAARPRAADLRARARALPLLARARARARVLRRAWTDHPPCDPGRHPPARGRTGPEPAAGRHRTSHGTSPIGPAERSESGIGRASSATRTRPSLAATMSRAGSTPGMISVATSPSSPSRIAQRSVR